MKEVVLTKCLSLECEGPHAMDKNDSLHVYNTFDREMLMYILDKAYRKEIEQSPNMV